MATYMYQINTICFGNAENSIMHVYVPATRKFNSKRVYRNTDGLSKAQSTDE